MKRKVKHDAKEDEMLKMLETLKEEVGYKRIKNQLRKIGVSSGIPTVRSNQ